MSGRELFGCVLMASAIVLVQMPEFHPGRKRAEAGETGETGKTKDGTQNA